jgi:hypothetical protein
VTALKPSQVRIHSSQLRFVPSSQRIEQTSALAEREKQKIQLSHSLAEPRPPGIALRRRSKTANGPRSFVNRWLNLKVASDPRTKRNQRIVSIQQKRKTPFSADRSLWSNRTPQGERLEQPEDFENNHDNNNHSNYVKDVSVHGAHSYQIARAMVNTYRNFYQPSIENSPNESKQQKGKSPSVLIPCRRSPKCYGLI